MTIRVISTMKVPASLQFLLFFRESQRTLTCLLCYPFLYKLTENPWLCFASLASFDFSLMLCNIKQSCHSSGQLWMLQYMDENQCWSWPVPNQKAVTTRTGTGSNLQDLFDFGSTCQILARYHSRGIKTRRLDQRTFIKINKSEIKTDIFYMT